jgi:intein/homing endonuclease
LQKTPNIRNTGGCPTPDMKIYLGSDNWVTAGNLVKGMEVYTVHEKTGEWGSYKVVHSEIIQQPVLSVKIGSKTVTVSASHKFLTDSGKYEDASALSIGSMIRTINGISPILEKKNIGESDVVKIEVQGAHTYVMEGFISHNKRAIEKIVE